MWVRRGSSRAFASYLECVCFVSRRVIFIGTDYCKPAELAYCCLPTTIMESRGVRPRRVVTPLGLERDRMGTRQRTIAVSTAVWVRGELVKRLVAELNLRRVVDSMYTTRAQHEPARARAAARLGYTTNRRLIRLTFRPLCFFSPCLQE